MNSGVLNLLPFLPLLPFAAAFAVGALPANRRGLSALIAAAVMLATGGLIRRDLARIPVIGPRWFREPA